MSSQNQDDCKKQLKELQNQYQKLQQEYETILNSTHDLIFFIGVEKNGTFRFLKGNNQYQKLTGYSQEKIAGKTMYQLFDQEIADFLCNNYKKCCKTKDVITLEETLPFPNGTRTYSTTLTPIIENGEVIQIVGFSQDITEHKLMENRRMYRNKILTALANKEELADVLSLTIQWLESEDPQAKGAIMLLDKNKEKLHLAAAPSLPDEFKQEIDGLRIEKAGVACSAAAHSGKRSVVEDTFTHPDYHFKELAQKFNLRSCWSEPVYSSQGEIIATFVVYHNKPKSPDEKDLKDLKFLLTQPG
ncbi:PAS domain-containing protein [Natranaerobius thermophilus]|uniref:Putative PAS/PAC sensor protein n=1 Tax=Natranaerobius thermophilus (strain ATCC BAA-1301 / DSM 18059 / JW/NM-WN-LF) TaxID=457570 RepID=B2A7R9_NATTJ|nr:PAS domain-containing protein [Natranaerobius thermophilus]ACB84371.1 putative PAS/PAC sensor protein [Natranaerobius thermophilus JW/NM-WN-LF]